MTCMEITKPLTIWPAVKGTRGGSQEKSVVKDAPLHVACLLRFLAADLPDPLNYDTGAKIRP